MQRKFIYGNIKKADLTSVKELNGSLQSEILYIATRSLQGGSKKVSC